MYKFFPSYGHIGFLANRPIKPVFDKLVLQETTSHSFFGPNIRSKDGSLKKLVELANMI